jgi:hypothetical protein
MPTGTKNKSKNMSKFTRFSRRIRFMFVAVVLGMAAGLSDVLTARPALADQVANRSIEMSDSGVSGGAIVSGVGSGTGVSYSISFGLSTSSGYTSGKMLSYIVDFCADSPLIGDTCSAPSGLDLSSATVTSGNTAGWTITTTGSQIKVSNATGIADGSTITLTMSGITNPSTLGPFYARIYTYADDSFGSTSGGGAYTDPQHIGGDVDYGGIALTTATPVSVTAKVQEEITFCVSGTAMTADCVGESAPDVTIGHGTLTKTLDGTAVDTAAAYMQTSTNAQAGAAVRMKAGNSCGGLSADGGTTCGIPPSTGFTTADIGSTTGNAAYGLNVASSTDGIGAMDADSPYATAGTYVMAYDNTNTTGVTSTYGSEIADSSGSGSVSNVDNTLTFAATASNTTTAGIYTTDMGLIATGTF